MEPLLVYPDPPPEWVSRALERGGYPWRGVSDPASAEREEPEDGFAGAVISALDDPAAAVREMARVARRALVVSVPFEPFFRIGNVLRGKYLDRLGDYPEHVQHWNPRTFRAFLSGSVAEVRIIEAFPWIIACCRLNQL